ncbi:ATP-binding protein [Streptomyces sp. Ru71]|uniref:ATP-binding protein n=1 Tax=Streptomyces sp. Ru71 TaxID=2080746 RepID=UPI000CDE2279|nr:ATP-binding protein [Streptomyces sp. Ru71]POX56535.1 ATP-binding protein [Streptomyces sp. Ru71]
MYTTTLNETSRPLAGSSPRARSAARPLGVPHLTTPAGRPPQGGAALAREAVVALPAEVRWVPVARRCIVAVLAQWGVPATDREAAELVVGELAANAAEHGHRDMTVRVSLHAGDLWISVTDSGAPGLPRPAGDADPDVHGRGLAIVELLARRVLVRQGPLGRRVDVALPLNGRFGSDG